MAEEEVVRDRRLTEKDLICIRQYLPELINLAENDEVVSYEALEERTGKRGGIRSVGRRLTWLSFFTKPKGLPSLDILVVKKGSTEVARKDNGSAHIERQACFECTDWHTEEMDEYFSMMEKFLKSRFTLARMEAYLDVKILPEL